MVSKLSIHVNRPGDEVLAFASVAKPRYIVVLLPQCDYQFIKNLKEASPGTRIAGRHWDDSVALERPEECIDKFWRALTGYQAVQERLIEDVFGPNEMNTTQGDNIYKLIAIDKELGLRFRNQNYRYWMFSTAERQPPDVDDWNWTRDVRFRECAEIAAGYCVHAYWWPTFGANGDPLRHQRWYAKLPVNLKKPVLIKECGADAGVIHQSHRGWITAYDGLAQTALSDCIRWDKALDAAVVGAHIFAYDHSNSDWWDFAVQRNGLLQLLGEYIRSQEVSMPGIIDLVDRLPRERTPAQRALSDIKYIVIHHAAAVTTPEATARYHVLIKGWPCIGYHYFIKEDGTTYQTARLNEITYHVGTNNPICVGVCLSGAYHAPNPPPPQAQLDSLNSLVCKLEQELGLTHQAIKGHCELSSTLCPGIGWFIPWRASLTGPSPEEVITELRGALQHIATFASAILNKGV